MRVLEPQHAVVITGSRDLQRWEPVYALLNQWPQRTLIIHGACPTGADHYAAAYAAERFMPAVAMPAQWGRDGNRSAGPKRNGAMVRLAMALRDCGWVVECHGFPVGKSRGTRGCMGAFEAQGFKVVEHA